MFSDKIKQLRSGKGYTMEELGRLVGVAKTTVANWEHGINYPNTEILIKLAELFTVSTDELLGVPHYKLENIANIKRDPNNQGSIDRLNRMHEQGLTDEQIDEVIDFSIKMLDIKKTVK